MLKNFSSLPNILKGYKPVSTVDIESKEEPDHNPSYWPLSKSISSYVTGRSSDAPEKLESSGYWPWSKTQASSAQGPVCFGLSWGQRLVGFMLFFGSGVLFLLLAMMRLPTMIISGVSSFAVPYTLSNCLLLGGACFLTGTRKQCSNMMQRNRLPYSMGYMVTMILTLYFTFNGYHFYVIIPVVTVQFVAMFLYSMTYVPGGMSCAKFCAKIGKICGRGSFTSIRWLLGI
jgi:hypothetical protein